MSNQCSGVGSSRRSGGGGKGAARVLLHLGAHKTATTFLQEWMTANADTLHRHGVAWPRLDETRKLVTKACWYPIEANVEAASQYLQERAASVEGLSTLVISDENILGVTASIGGDCWYEGTADRLGNLAKLLDRLGERMSIDAVDVALSVRSYDRFASSMYAESLRHGPYVSSAKWLSAIDMHNVGWRSLLQLVRAELDAETVRVWKYEDFRGHRRAIVDWILPELRDAELDDLDSDRNPSITDLTVRALKALWEALPPSAYAIARDAIVGKVGGEGAVTCFDSPVAARLRARYDGEVAELPSQIDGLEMFPGVVVSDPAAT